MNMYVDCGLPLFPEQRILRISRTFREQVLKAINNQMHRTLQTKSSRTEHVEDVIWDSVGRNRLSVEIFRDSNKPFLTVTRNTSIFLTFFQVKTTLICSSLQHLQGLGGVCVQEGWAMGRRKKILDVIPQCLQLLTGWLLGMKVSTWRSTRTL